MAHVLSWPSVFSNMYIIYIPTNFLNGWFIVERGKSRIKLKVLK